MTLDVANEVLSKQDKSPVTMADFAAQALIIRAILTAFPLDRIVGEEDAKELRKEEQHELRRRVVSLATEFSKFGLESISPLRSAAGETAKRAKEQGQEEKDEKDQTEGVLWCIDQGAFDGLSYGETQQGAARRHWCVDPIDGTKGFLRKQQYAVCVGLVVNGEVVLGALACPNLPFKGGENEERTEAAGVVLVGAKGRGTLAFSLEDLIRTAGIDDGTQ